MAHRQSDWLPAKLFRHLSGGSLYSRMRQRSGSNASTESRVATPATAQQRIAGLPNDKSATSTRRSRYRGVSWDKAKQQWRARVGFYSNKLCVCYQEHHLGFFGSERLAGRAYDRAARMSFADQATLNFPNIARRQGETECCGRGCKFCAFDWVNVPKSNKEIENQQHQSAASRTDSD